MQISTRVSNSFFIYDVQMCLVFLPRPLFAIKFILYAQNFAILLNNFYNHVTQRNCVERVYTRVHVYMYTNIEHTQRKKNGKGNKRIKVRGI